MNKIRLLFLSVLLAILTTGCYVHYYPARYSGFHGQHGTVTPTTSGHNFGRYSK